MNGKAIAVNKLTNQLTGNLSIFMVDDLHFKFLFKICHPLQHQDKEAPGICRFIVSSRIKNIDQSFEEPKEGCCCLTEEPPCVMRLISFLCRTPKIREEILGSMIYLFSCFLLFALGKAESQRKQKYKKYWYLGRQISGFRKRFKIVKFLLNY